MISTVKLLNFYTHEFFLNFRSNWQNEKTTIQYKCHFDYDKFQNLRNFWS